MIKKEYLYKIYSSNVMAFLIFFGIFFFLFMCIISFSMYIKEKNIIFLICSIFSACLITFFVILGNKCVCKLFIKKEKIIRNGLFFGLKYELKIKDLKKVVIKTIDRESTFIYLIDDINNNYKWTSKKPYIRLEYTEKNVNILKEIGIEIKKDYYKMV